MSPIPHLATCSLLPALSKPSLIFLTIAPCTCLLLAGLHTTATLLPAQLHNPASLQPPPSLPEQPSSLPMQSSFLHAIALPCQPFPYRPALFFSLPAYTTTSFTSPSSLLVRTTFLPAGLHHHPLEHTFLSANLHLLPAGQHHRPALATSLHTVAILHLTSSLSACTTRQPAAEQSILDRPKLLPTTLHLQYLSFDRISLIPPLRKPAPLLQLVLTCAQNLLEVDELPWLQATSSQRQLQLLGSSGHKS